MISKQSPVHQDNFCSHLTLTRKRRKKLGSRPLCFFFFFFFRYPQNLAVSCAKLGQRISTICAEHYTITFYEKLKKKIFSPLLFASLFSFWISCNHYSLANTIISQNGMFLVFWHTCNVKTRKELVHTVQKHKKNCLSNEQGK